MKSWPALWPAVVVMIDASASMEPCLAGVRTHIADFATGLRAGQQTHWDVRFDFVAHAVAGVVAHHALQDVVAAPFTCRTQPERRLTAQPFRLRRSDEALQHTVCRHIGVQRNRGDRGGTGAPRAAVPAEWRRHDLLMPAEA